MKQVLIIPNINNPQKSLELAKKYPDRFIVIDARRKIEEIAKEVIEKLTERGCL